MVMVVVMRSMLAIFMLCGVLSTAASAPGLRAEVRWRAKTYPVAELPAELPPRARAAIDAWAAFADAGGYRMDLEEEGRVLLISPARNSRVAEQMKLIRKTLDLFEEALPAPKREAVAQPAGSPGPTTPTPKGSPLPEDPEDGPLPEDPEDGPVPPPAKETVPEWSMTWGAEGVPLDSETIVFFVVRDEAAFAKVLDALAARHAHLVAWSKEARQFTGFSLQAPLAGAYIELAEGQEEWNPDNEVVHRVAELLLVRRFGQLPYWLLQGWAWHAETALLGAIYCYPYRDEFVFAVEHTGWRSELKNRYSDRDALLTMQELAGWHRGRFAPEPAQAAWGMVDFLLKRRAGTLPRIAEELRILRDRENRVDHGDGTWERRTDYEVPADAQEKILKQAAGEDVLRAASEYFRSGGEKGG